MFLLYHLTQLEENKRNYLICPERSRRTISEIVETISEIIVEYLKNNILNEISKLTSSININSLLPLILLSFDFAQDKIISCL